MVAPLKAPKPVPPWARALLFHGERSSVGDWEAFIGAAFG